MGQTKKVLDLLEGGNALRSFDFKAAGIDLQTVSRLVRAGRVSSPLKGVYLSIDNTATEIEQIAAAVSLKYERSLCCLFTAARYHELTDDMSAPWGVAVRHNGPLGADNSIRIYRWQKDDAFALGVETHEMCGVDVKITSKARTVADMLRPRNATPSEHSLGAFAQFISSGGQPEEVSQLSAKLGYETKFDDIVPLVRRMMDVGAISEDPGDDFNFSF